MGPLSDPLFGSYRVTNGHGKPGKPGKSWNKMKSHGIPEKSGNFKSTEAEVMEFLISPHIIIALGCLTYIVLRTIRS